MKTKLNLETNSSYMKSINFCCLDNETISSMKVQLYFQVVSAFLVWYLERVKSAVGTWIWNNQHDTDC